jgi:hypothetical protein
VGVYILECSCYYLYIVVDRDERRFVTMNRIQTDHACDHGNICCDACFLAFCLDAWRFYTEQVAQQEEAFAMWAQAGAEG